MENTRLHRDGQEEARAFQTDEHLIYRTPGVEFRRMHGQDLILSREYPTTQLPLVNPAHPDVVNCDPSTGYDWMGTYASPRFSVIGFVDFTEMSLSPVFREFLNVVATTAANDKISWETVDRRRHKHHMTICGRLEDRFSEREVVDFVSERLLRMPSFSVRIKGGWFWGPKNGRLYFPAYPEMNPCGTTDYLTEVQQRLSAPLQPGFFIGCLQLTDHLVHDSQLGVHEADDLFDALLPFRDKVLAEVRMTQLAVLRTHDDLILNSRVLRRIPLEP